jgi:hypothetical protein
VNVTSLSQELYEFAVELRQLAYMMPGGQENPLIDLSERMLRCATNTPIRVCTCHGHGGRAQVLAP